MSTITPAPIPTTARRITPGTPVKQGTSVCIAGPTSGAGFVDLIMQDGSILTVYFAGNTMVLDGVAVVDLRASTSTATGFVASVVA